MDRFSRFRIVDSDDTESQEEPTLHPCALGPNDNAHSNDRASSAGSVEGGGDAKRTHPAQPAAQPIENVTPPENHVFPSQQHQIHKDNAEHDILSQGADALPVSSPDPRNPGRKAGETSSAAASSRHSQRSETSSAAQLHPTAPAHTGATTTMPSDAYQPAEDFTASHGVGVEAKDQGMEASVSSKVSLKDSKSKSASSSSAYNSEEADVPPSAEPVEQEMELQLPPQQGSQYSEEFVVEAAQAAATRDATAGAVGYGAGVPTQDLMDSDAAFEAVETAAPKKKKAFAGCGFFSLSKKKGRTETEAEAGTKAKAHAQERSGAQAEGPPPAAEALPKKKTFTTCGLCLQKKADKKKTADAEAPPGEQPLEETVSATVNGTDSAASINFQREGSGRELSIPVAVSGGDKRESPCASHSEKEDEKRETQQGAAASVDAPEALPSTGADETPQQPSQENEGKPEAADVRQATAPVPHTTSSCSSVAHSESPQKHEEATEESMSRNQRRQGEGVKAAASAAASEAAADKKEGHRKPASDRHTKRVKAVVRRKRQKPEKDDGAVETGAVGGDRPGGSEAYSTPHEEEKPRKDEGEGKHASKPASAVGLAADSGPTPNEVAAPVASTEPACTPAEHSEKRARSRPSADEAPTHSGSYSSYGSYSGSGSYSYSYSDSYTASSERDASNAPSRHSAQKAKSSEGKAASAVAAASTASAPQQRPKPAAHPAPNAPTRSSAEAPLRRSAQHTESSRPQNGAATRFTRWSVRADDLVLHEEEPPASMPAYQRRILLDLRARERRDAEEAARDLQELTFRPRIHTLPGKESSNTNIIEKERSHSPMGSGGQYNASPSYSPASGILELSPRRYVIRRMSPHLLLPRKAPQQPALPSFKPEINEYARKDMVHDRGVFHRLYRRSRSSSPVATPEYVHRPEISEFAKQLYTLPRGRRLPSRQTNGVNGAEGYSGMRYESVFTRLYRQRNSPSTSPNASPSRSAARPLTFHPQITELAQRQSEGVRREPVGDRLYRKARSPRREHHSPYQPLHHENANGSSLKVHRGYDEEEENVNDQGEYDPQREYATQREYGVGEVGVSRSDRASWTSSALSQSSFSVKAPASMTAELHRTFSEKQATVEAV
ncbi:hypothetical protein ABL78_8019 [Leptomonas seymouri]|uniref:Uncharacterized protein n=1 Tax=Leptomonas seymouri TaxID=5684 RepID=A0A0N1HZQ6_LEPSE|nr:hypothetical protein ABL78_8019 [Leptomonas seymouri]|eukprot:KPI82960.1 hypothetical protein ABL78_8019 [Leptomonas seymouri]